MPNLIDAWFRPTDARWQGSQKALLTLILVKLLIFVPFLVLCIVEVALYNKWIGNPSDNYTKDWVWFRWAGIGVLPEGLHTITQIILISISKFHPVFAISGSVIMFLLWTMSTWVNPFMAYSSELSFDERHSWENLCWAETGFMAVLVLLYIAMIVLSGIAVHRWRRAKREYMTLRMNAV